MNNRKYTSDMLSLWGAWNKANQKLWNHMLQSGAGQRRATSKTDLWKEWNQVNQELWNHMFVEEDQP